MSTDFSHQPRAVQAGHHVVSQDELNTLLCQALQRMSTVDGGQDIVIVFTQDIREDLHNPKLVIDHQNSCHSQSPGRLELVPVLGRELGLARRG